MKYISPSLLALAAIAAVPTVHGLDVKDDDVKLGLTLQLQVRGEVSKAKNAAAGTTAYNPAEGATGASDPVDFYLRRARIGFKGSWKGDYKFAFQMRSDNQDKASSATTGDGSSTTAPGQGNRLFQTHVAYIERVFKQEDLKIEHSVRAGLDYAFFNGASAVFSSSGFLLPAARATDQGNYLAPRGVGVGYKLSHELFTWGVDVQNNTADDAVAQADGLFYGTRLQVTGPGEWAIAKPTESFCGKDGKGVLLSVEFGKNTNAHNGATTVDRKAYGSELLVHVDALTALAEIRDSVDESTTVPAGVKTVTRRRIYLVQAGYALPMMDTVVEPAVRYTKIDNNRGNGSETTSFGAGDYGASGRQLEVGANWYLSGHNNKLQLAWLNWKSEAGAVGGDKAKADIVRAQWQLSF